MDNSIAELEKVIYKNKAAPEEWFAVAKRLEAAALILQEHHQTSNNAIQAIEDKAQEFMLWGFCLENLLKGLLARKKSEGGNAITKTKSDSIVYNGPRHHKLNEIAKQICFKLNEKEQLALTFLSKAIVYLGRYPLPLSSKELGAYWDDVFNDVLKSLLARLKKQAGIS